MAIADDDHIGTHPSSIFGQSLYAKEPREGTSLEDMQAEDDPAETQLGESDPEADQAATTTGVSRSEIEPQVYRYITAKFYNVQDIGRRRWLDSETPKDNTRFFLDYLISYAGTLSARNTSTWCAYKEITGSELATEYASKEQSIISVGQRIFTGPFALKLFNVDKESQASADVVIQKLLEESRKDENLASRILLPEQFVFHSFSICSL